MTTTYSYDALNRMTAIDYSDDTMGADFNYDQTSPWGETLTNTVGRLTTEYDADTGSDFSYDAMGRVLSNHQCTPQNCGTSDFQMNYTYDLIGDITSSTDGQYNMYTDTYNAATQLTELMASYTNPGTLLSSAVYNAPGELTSALLGNGKTETRAYNTRLRMTSLAVGSIYTLSMGYAPNGDVTSGNDSANGDWTYTYDDFNRLIGSSCSTHCPDGQNTQGFSYSYDRYGNRWKQTVTSGSGGTSSLSFTGSNNHIDGYSYDAAGNLLNDGVHSYTYDAEGRVVCVDSGTAIYVYDAEGRRVRKITGASSCSATTGTIADYLYDLSGHAMTEISGTGVWNRGEIYAGGRHLATYVSSTLYFDNADWLGTERVRTTVNGTVCETIVSMAFGDGQSATGSCTDVSPLHFTGKERDSESGLDNFGARYDASSLGRFMTPDWSAKVEPVPYSKLDNPQSLNLYSYVLNNPLSNIDTDGHACSGVLGNTGSGFCTRATEYGKFDAISGVQSQTRFFAAANAVSQALADVAAFSPLVRMNGVSGQTANFLEGVGQNLEKLNQAEASAIQNGSLSGPNLDQQLVHNEQTAVQGQLDSLQQSDPAAYSKTISEINGALNPGALGKEASSLFSTDKAFQGVLAGVRKDLGRNIDFSKQSDREAIGNALINHVRQTGGCDVNGTRQPGCGR